MGVRVMKRITSRIVKLFFVLILLLNASFVYANNNLFNRTIEVNKYFLEVAYKLCDFSVLEQIEVKEVNKVEEVKYNNYSEPNNEYVIEGNSIKVASIYNHLMNDDG